MFRSLKINFYFILKFSEELKRWFIQQEVDLFRFKLTKISHDSQFIDKFLKDNDLHYEPVDIFIKKCGKRLLFE
jgi:hypothetical protein